MQISSNKWISGFFLIAGLAIIAYGGTTSRKAVARTSQDVFVTNTASTPVPVLPVRNSIVYAQQSGPWFTQISNTPTVKVGNTTSSPVNVKALDSGNRDGFQIYGQTTISDGWTVSTTMTYFVPNNMVFNMDYVSTQSQTDTGGHYATYMQVFVRDSNQNTVTSATIPLTPSWGSSVFSIVSEPIHVIAGPGQEVLIAHYREVTSGNTTNNVMVSGHLTSAQ